MILHILLLILKIIGIILLVLLGLLLLILCTILFVPLRYRIAAVRNPDEFTADAAVTWLLRLIRLSVSYRDGTVLVTLKAAFLTLKTVEKKIKKSSKNSGRTRSSADQRTDSPAADHMPAEKEDNKEKQRIRESADNHKDPSSVSDENSKAAEETPSADVSGKPSAAAEHKEKLIQSKERKEQKQPERPEKEKDSGEGNKGEKKEKTGIIKVITGKVSALIEKICTVPEKIADLMIKVIETVESGADKADSLEEKIESLEKKAEPFLSNEAKGTVRVLIRQVKKMLRHYRIRRVKGFLRYGFERPDLTAMTGGLLYQILPAGADHFTIDPHWNEKIFETDVTASGHVRLCHVAAAAIVLAVRRDTWRLIKKIRKKR